MIDEVGRNTNLLKCPCKFFVSERLTSFGMGQRILKHCRPQREDSDTSNLAGIPLSKITPPPYRTLKSLP